MVQVLVVLGMFLFVLFAVLGAAILVFRVACRLCGVEAPGVMKSAVIIVATTAVLAVCEVVMASAVRGVYDRLNYPLWEAGVVAFFVGLPVDLVVASAVHAAFLRVKFGKAVEVWFAHRLILLTFVMLAAGLIAVGYLASNK